MATPFDDEVRFEVPETVQRALRDVPESEHWTKRAFSGWPANVVNEAAASWNASLILVGLGHHRAIDRLFGTETAINIIKHAKIPVVAVPAAVRELPRHVCAAIDFTPASTAAAMVAASLLGENGKVTLLHVSPFFGVETDTDVVAQAYRSVAGTRLAEVLSVVRRQTKHQVDGLLLEGEPSQIIADFARSDHCDLVALGGHAQGLVDRILIGSIRTRLLRTVGCSVLIAPPEPGGE